MRYHSNINSSYGGTGGIGTQTKADRQKKGAALLRSIERSQNLPIIVRGGSSMYRLPVLDTGIIAYKVMKGKEQVLLSTNPLTAYKCLISL